MRARFQSRRGFTLTEVLISTALASVVMAAVMSTYIYMGRSMARLTNYQALENESRKALTYLQRDFEQAISVKGGTSPTTSAVTLLLPAGEVTYTYDGTSRQLRRQATFGGVPDILLLTSSSCECPTFAFSYFTTLDGAPTDQVTPSLFVPFSIKQIQVQFTVQSPTSFAASTRSHFQTTSARHLFRNRGAPDGT